MPVIPASPNPAAPLATAADVQTLMPGVALDLDQVDLLLDIASSTIRDFTVQTLSLVDDDVLELRGGFARDFYLPERPVLDVTSISLNDQPFAAGSYRASSDGRVTIDRSAWSAVVNGPDVAVRGHWGGDERFLTVVYSHGYDPVPASIKGVCLDLVRRGIVAPDAGVIRQESLGSYNVSYAPEAASVLSTGDERRLRRYCRRNATVLVGR